MKVLSFIKNQNFYDVYFNDNEKTEIIIKNKCNHTKTILNDWKTPYNPLINFMVDSVKELHILSMCDFVKNGLIDELNNGNYEQKEMLLKEIL